MRSAVVGSRSKSGSAAVNLRSVEHLNVLEQIGPGFVSVAIADPDDPFALENTEEAFNDGIVIAVAGTAHGAFDVVFGQRVAEIIA